MTQMEKLEQEAFDLGVSVDYIDFRSPRLSGLYIDGSIALRKGMSTNKSADTLAEELEHHYTTVGNILDQKATANKKQEHHARFRAYNRRIGLIGIINGYKARCESRFELAEYLDVTEEFLQEALDCYRSKYGTRVTVDNYVILFEPSLAVMEKL